LVIFEKLCLNTLIQKFGLKNALIRGFPNALKSNAAPNIVLANDRGVHIWVMLEKLMWWWFFP